MLALKKGAQSPDDSPHGQLGMATIVYKVADAILRWQNKGMQSLESLKPSLPHSLIFIYALRLPWLVLCCFVLTVAC